MIRILAAALALLIVAGCGDDTAPDERLYGLWKHIASNGARLDGTVRFSRSGQFTMTDFRRNDLQRSVDYSGRFEFVGEGRLQLKVRGEHGGTYEGEMGFRIGDEGSGERLSLSLPGSVAGGRRAIFER